MGRKRSSNTKDSEYSTFYEYIWTQRLNWTGKLIPIRYLNKDTGFFIEGYISGAVKKFESGGRVSVTHSRLPTAFPSTRYIYMDLIHPTKRRFTKLTEQGIIEAPPIETNKNWDPAPRNFIRPHEISSIYSTNPDIYWTIPELLSMLNADVPEEKVKELADLQLQNYRICSIKGSMQPVYSLNKLKVSDTVSELLTTESPLEALKESYSNCQKCPLGEDRNRDGRPVVMGRGNPNKPKLFIIGEAPGNQEEDNRRPFYEQAPAGNVLYRVMNAAGLDQEKDCYLTNAVWCRPLPEDNSRSYNGSPKVAEVEACNSRLKAELHIVSPKVVLLLGRWAYRAYFGKDPEKGVMASQGWIHDIPTYYPTYFLSHPSFIKRVLANTYDPEKAEAIKISYLAHFKEIARLAHFIESQQNE